LPARSSAPAPLTSRPFRRLQIVTILIACAAAFVPQAALSIGGPARKSLAPLAIGPRQETAVIALGGRISVLGGFDRHNRVVDTWQTLPPMLTPRHGTAGAAVGDKVYVPGGATREGFGATAINESFDPSS